MAEFPGNFHPNEQDQDAMIIPSSDKAISVSDDHQGTLSPKRTYQFQVRSEIRVNVQQQQ